MCKNADDTSIGILWTLAKEKEKKNRGWLSQIKRWAENREIVCQSVGRCIVCVVRFIYSLLQSWFLVLFSFFLSLHVPTLRLQNQNVAHTQRKKTRTTSKLELNKTKKEIEIKTNPPKNVLFDATDSVHKLCENFVIYWSFEVQIERIFPYDSKSNVVRIDSAKRTKRIKQKPNWFYFVLLLFFSSLFWHRLPFWDSKHR